MKYPSFVYVSPGAHQCPGGTYSYRRVTCEDDVAQAAQDGYYPTVDLAMAKPTGFDWGEYLGYGKAPDASEDPKPASPKPATNTAPSREELEARATELGIGFNARTKDAKLAARIKEREGK